MTPTGWLRMSQGILVGILVLTPLTVAMSLTVGLVTGLLVVMVPAYLLGLWLALVALATSVAMWRGRRGVARVAGTVGAAVPPLALVGWYAAALAGCGSSADPAECRAYLNGSPLLPALVILVLAVGVGAVVLVWVASAWAATPPVRPVPNERT